MFWSLLGYQAHRQGGFEGVRSNLVSQARPYPFPSADRFQLQNAQLEFFSHVNTVILTFILRAREGRIRQLQRSVSLDALIKGRKSEYELRARQQEVIVNFVKDWDAVFMSPPTGSGETCYLVLT